MGLACIMIFADILLGLLRIFFHLACVKQSMTYEKQPRGQDEWTNKHILLDVADVRCTGDSKFH